MVSENLILIGLSLSAIIIYIICIFILFEIKKRVEGQISSAFTFAVMAVITLSIIRILDLFVKIQLINKIKFLHESLIILFSFFFLIAIIIFYKSVSSVTDQPTRKRKTRIPNKKKEKKKRSFFRFFFWRKKKDKNEEFREYKQKLKEKIEKNKK